MIPSLALTLIAYTLAGASLFGHGDGCRCPEAQPGWVIYPDSARGMPDFYSHSTVALNGILICEGSVHLLFDAKQDGRRRHVCMVVAEIPFERWFRDIPADSVLTDEDIAALAQDCDWEKMVFKERVGSLEKVLGDRARVNETMTFKTGWFRHPPKVWLGSPLLVKWHGRRAELVGKVDVYFAD
jgi:hypothetical protein